ncbi:MAG TPA: aldo/keto reductase family protein [Planctomycetota bacterium]|nr:aldo/keto reductase family protein [Planctomycetota bacterium]
MRYRPLGNTGCKVSVLSLGSWMTFGGSVDQATTNACVAAALEAGVNLFDTADIYGHGAAETALGVALEPYRRQDLVLATKLFWPMTDGINDRGLSRKHIRESVEGSLRRLGTDYIDLYQCHRPDPETPVEETVRAMEDLIRQGKLLYWGVSVWTAGQIVAACESADRWGGYRPVSNQPPYSLLEREIEREVLATCDKLGLSQIVWSPLAQGLLTGKYRGGTIPPGSRAADEQRNKFLKPMLHELNLKRAAHVATVAAELGLTPAQVSLAWVLRRREISSAILGVTRVEQLRENLAAAEVELKPETIARLEAGTLGGG